MVEHIMKGTVCVSPVEVEVVENIKKGDYLCFSCIG